MKRGRRHRSLATACNLNEENDATTKQHKILVGFESAQSSKFACHPGGCCTSSDYSWISDSQVRRPTTLPRAGVYITKSGRWICSSGLHPRACPVSDPFRYMCVCVCVYTHNAYVRRRKRAAFVPGGTETRSFSLIQISRRVLQSRIGIEATSSSRNPSLPTQVSCISYSLLSIWSRRDVIDFSPTVHSPLNNASRFADLEIIGCPWHPWHLSSLRVVSRPAESPRDIDGVTLTLDWRHLTKRRRLPLGNAILFLFPNIRLAKIKQTHVGITNYERKLQVHFLFSAIPTIRDVVSVEIFGYKCKQKHFLYNEEYFYSNLQLHSYKDAMYDASSALRAKRV